MKTFVLDKHDKKLPENAESPVGREHGGEESARMARSPDGFSKMLKMMRLNRQFMRMPLCQNGILRMRILRQNLRCQISRRTMTSFRGDTACPSRIPRRRRHPGGGEPVRPPRRYCDRGVMLRCLGQRRARRERPWTMWTCLQKRSNKGSWISSQRP